jgi:diguanylate cyclase (GGDEF)-like protein
MPDAVILEVVLPRGNGFEVLKSLKSDQRTSAIPVILLIDESDDYGEHRGRICGADVILRRPFTSEALMGAVFGSLAGLPAPPAEKNSGPKNDLAGVLDALEGRARAENPLLEHITDPLTGLFNNAYTDLKLMEEFKKARRFQMPLAAMMLGFDDQRNFSNPGSSGDVRRILNEVAGILLCESRDIDHVARYSDREFLALLPHTDMLGGTSMAERIVATIAGRAFTLSGGTGALTASAGVCAFMGTGMETAEELPLRAREALAASRSWGGNRVTVWDGEPKKLRR